MARRSTVSKPRAWSERDRAPAAPWSEAELEELKTLSRVGLASQFWHVALPSRRFPEIINKREELRERGGLVIARRI